MSDITPLPVQLDKVLGGLAENPALPRELVRRLFAYRRGFGSVAKRLDLTDDMIAEIISIDDHWLTHSLALNRTLPHVFRMTLAEHPDPAIRAAVVIGANDAPRELFERLLGDTHVQVREYLAQSDHVPPDLRARLAADPDPKIRATLAQWWTQAPEAVRRVLLTDPEDTVRAAACATYYRRLPHPVPPADLLPGLLADPVTRAGAVRHCTLDADTAGRLAEDPDEEVRVEVAEHPDIRRRCATSSPRTAVRGSRSASSPVRTPPSRPAPRFTHGSCPTYLDRTGSPTARTWTTRPSNGRSWARSRTWSFGRCVCHG